MLWEEQPDSYKMKIITFPSLVLNMAVETLDKI
jgi:hypothetical protein